MADGIVYQNKDVTSKVFADMFGEKSLNVYGLNLPRVKRILPTNLPVIEANERRPDAVIEFVDGSFAVIDYESVFREEKMITYGEYLLRLAARLTKDGIPFTKIRMVVIYTADVTRDQVITRYDREGFKIRTEAAFLSELDSECIRAKLNAKVKAGEPLSDEELMEFIILPLSYRSKEKKKEILTEAVELAGQIGDSKTSTFILSGLMVFSDKIIDEETREKIRRSIQMTQIEKMIRDEEAQKYEKLIAKKDDALKEKDDAIKKAQREKDAALKEAQKEKEEELNAKDRAARVEKAEFVINTVENVVRNNQVPYEDACRIIGISMADYAASALLLLRQSQQRTGA